MFSYLSDGNTMNMRNIGKKTIIIIITIFKINNNMCIDIPTIVFFFEGMLKPFIETSSVTVVTRLIRNDH